MGTIHTMAWDVVIAGGGFGGLYAARTLERLLPPQSARITLVSDVNFLLYTPLLPGRRGGHARAAPRRRPAARGARRHRRCGSARCSAPIPARELASRRSTGRRDGAALRPAVVALGSVSRTLPVPGLAEHALGFKSLPEAIAMRNRLIVALETAEALDDPGARASG